MDRNIYRYSFSKKIPHQDIEDSLFLAVLAVESLHGRSHIKMEASFCLDKEKRSCVVDAGTEIGRHIARIFTGFLTREFGENAFKVNFLGRRDDSKTKLQTTGAA
jgi:phosphopentomutase